MRVYEECMSGFAWIILYDLKATAATARRRASFIDFYREFY